MKGNRLSLWTSLVLALCAAPAAHAGCWAAIAYNSTTHVWGETHAADTLADAESSALNVCGGGCAILGWTDHGYVALATGPNGWGISTAEPDAGTAESVALEECNSVSTGCAWNVWVSGCD